MPKHPSEANASRGLTHSRRQTILRYLQLGWHPDDIALEVNVSSRTVYKYRDRWCRYGTVATRWRMKLGRPRQLTLADEDALEEHLRTEGWMYQDEMMLWLLCERGVRVSRPTIVRMLKRRKLSKSKIYRTSHAQNESLRESWRADCGRFNAEDFVFLDESIFNEKTGWRYGAYGPIGSENRHRCNNARGDTWSVLGAYTIDQGFVPCTGVLKGYFSTIEVLHWLKNALLPRLAEADNPRRRVIVLDNCSTHCDPIIGKTIVDAGHIVRYLPPYSPDFNPIELAWSVLKAWMRRNWILERHKFDSFGAYLTHSIVASRCDRFAREHFKHAANGLYMLEEERERFFAFCRRFEAEETRDGETQDGSS